ncbi:thioredoxin H1-like isoform X2 [Impatiens glandulifera]|uniref:thioredoxin H1-like isoform X2 n=1 Tax=Impatiens glandulifera TaxID=253017 RepID=UPI001FB0841D|nr:thioredoxin H1-like isoform X2 [Impatiens glandulifera]
MRTLKETMILELYPSKSKFCFLNSPTMASSSEEGQVISCHTLEEFNQKMQKGKESKKLVVVNFTATWCGPCKFIAPYYEELASKMLEIIFLKIDVDELRSVADDFDVKAMPTFVFVKDGNIVDRTLNNKFHLLSKITLHSVVTV